MRERERERERQRQRQRQRQRDRERHRERQRQRQRERDRDRERQRDRERKVTPPTCKDSQGRVHRPCEGHKGDGVRLELLDQTGVHHTHKVGQTPVQKIAAQRGSQHHPGPARVC